MADGFKERAKSWCAASCKPTSLPKTDQLAWINNELNAVQLHAAFADAQLPVCKGTAGGPTASAVLSDLCALRHG